ncbi:hypothetical protein [Pseudorhodobacter ferrugineus]|nr:hypothetical protein [Pseudorhodobacter ferrugineus]
MTQITKTPAQLALDILAQAYAYYDAPPTQSKLPQPLEYYEYVAAA